MTGQPAARALAALCAAIGAGALYGTTHNAGPSGARRTSTA